MKWQYIFFETQKKINYRLKCYNFWFVSKKYFACNSSLGQFFFQYSSGPIARETIMHAKIMWKSIFFGGNWPRGNCLASIIFGEISRGSIIWKKIIREAIIWGNYLGRNYPGGNHPVDNFPQGKLSRQSFLLTIPFLQATLFLQAILLLFYVTGLEFLITFSILIYLARSAKLICTACYFHFNHGFESQYICWKLTDFYEVFLTGSLNFPQRNKGHLEWAKII